MKLPAGSLGEDLSTPGPGDDVVAEADSFRFEPSDLAVNAAIARWLTDGVVRSTTPMVPCARALHAMQWLASLVAEDNSVRAKPRLRRRRLSRPATFEDFPAIMSEG
jgi:hypothetical protein